MNSNWWLDMVNRLLVQLKEKTTVGKTVWFYEKNIRKKTYYKMGIVVDEVSQISLGKEYKHFIQKIKYPKGGYGFRICYYTITRKKDKIVFGQYASQMSQGSFRSLMRKAKKKGFFG